MSSDDENDEDANVIPIYDQKIFNFCGRIKIHVLTFLLFQTIHKHHQTILHHQTTSFLFLQREFTKLLSFLLLGLMCQRLREIF